MLQYSVCLSPDDESSNDVERVDSVVQGITVDSNSVGESAHTSQGIVNPLRMSAHAQEGYSSRFVCLSVCYHSSRSRVDLCCPSVVPTESARYFEDF